MEPDVMRAEASVQAPGAANPRPASTKAQEVVMCSGACGKFWPLDDIDRCPWELMTMKKAVRCWECGRALVAAGQAGAGVEASYQELAPTDRGALKKMPDRPALREGPGQSNGNLEWDE